VVSLLAIEGPRAWKVPGIEDVRLQAKRKGHRGLACLRAAFSIVCLVDQFPRGTYDDRSRLTPWRRPDGEVPRAVARPWFGDRSRAAASTSASGEPSSKVERVEQQLLGARRRDPDILLSAP